MFISYRSHYSAWFKRHKSSVSPPELRQKLSPFCVLLLWLKPTFRQCRNTVEMKDWFNHLACHWKLMLARRGFTPFAFPRFQHLYIQLGSVCKDAGWVVCGAPGHTQFRAWILCQDLWPPFQTHWHRQSMEAQETGTSARRQRWTSEDGEAVSQRGAQNSKENLRNKNN